MRDCATKKLRFVAVLLAAAAVQGCASGARPGAMVATVDGNHIIDSHSPFYMATTVEPITGGKETSPLWASKVSNDSFRQALKQSLKLNAMLAGTQAKYKIDVTLLDLKQPLLGLDMTVTSSVHYTVSPVAGGAPIYDQTITSPYTANFSDAFVGVERLRLANEGAIRKSITDFIAALSTVQAAGVPTS